MKKLILAAFVFGTLNSWSQLNPKIEIGLNFNSNIPNYSEFAITPINGGAGLSVGYRVLPYLGAHAFYNYGVISNVSSGSAEIKADRYTWDESETENPNYYKLDQEHHILNSYSNMGVEIVYTPFWFKKVQPLVTVGMAKNNVSYGVYQVERQGLTTNENNTKTGFSPSNFDFTKEVSANINNLLPNRHANSIFLGLGAEFRLGNKLELLIKGQLAHFTTPINYIIINEMVIRNGNVSEMSFTTYDYFTINGSIGFSFKIF